MVMQDSYITIAWLGLLILLLIIEIITVGLTSIWAAGGALAALILNILGLSLVWQIVAFFVVTFVLLIFTRPFAVRFIKTQREKTNYEGIIDNMRQTGMAVVNGQEWTVRAQEDQEILEPETLAKVVNISGVKLIVKKYEEE